MKSTISFPLPEAIKEDMILKVSEELFSDIEKDWIEEPSQGHRMVVEIDKLLKDKEFQIVRQWQTT